MVVREAYRVNPPYNIWLTVWKGIRPALWLAGSAAILVFLGYFSDTAKLIELGLPPMIAVVIGEVCRNLIKEYRRRK